MNAYALPQTRPSSRSSDLVRRYGRTDAVNGLSLRVQPGRCYGFFGRNGAGKTTTIKCLLNLLRPTSGEARVFGLDPARHEVAVKSRLAYVPDHVAFYPWMTVRDTLDYFASFRAHWNRDTERALARPVPARSAPEDEPPVERAADAARAHHRRSVRSPSCWCSTSRPPASIRSSAASSSRRSSAPTRTASPGRRTVFVSTHLISEFEGLIDEFTIIERGRRRADARRPTRRASATRRSTRALPTEPAALDLGGARVLRQRGREIEVVVNGNAADVLERLKARSPETLTTEALTLEEIFVATLQPEGVVA